MLFRSTQTAKGGPHQPAKRTQPAAHLQGTPSPPNPHTKCQDETPGAPQRRSRRPRPPSNGNAEPTQPSESNFIATTQSQQGTIPTYRPRARPVRHRRNSRNAVSEWNRQAMAHPNQTQRLLPLLAALIYRTLPGDTTWRWGPRCCTMLFRAGHHSGF